MRKKLQNLLIVDDDEQVCRILDKYFTDLGYDSHYCTFPEEALGLLTTQHFEVALIDLKMPKITGIQFIEKAKRIQPLLRYVILTGSLNNTDQEDLLLLGLDRELILHKPIRDLSELEKRMHDCFHRENGLCNDRV